MRIDPSKVEDIVNFPTPKTIIDVRIFLGAAQYWRKFIANVSTIAAPMHVVTSVKKGLQWGGKQKQDFEALKYKINSAPVLAFANLRQPFEI